MTWCAIWTHHSITVKELPARSLERFKVLRIAPQVTELFERLEDRLESEGGVAREPEHGMGGEGEDALCLWGNVAERQTQTQFRESGGRGSSFPDSGCVDQFELTVQQSGGQRRRTAQGRRCARGVGGDAVWTRSKLGILACH